MAEGYTKIKNKLFDGLARLRISGSAFKVLMVIIRNTVCYGRDRHRISNGFLQKATGLCERNVIRAIQELCSMGIIKITEQKSGSRPKTIRIYTDKIVMMTKAQEGTDKNDSIHTDKNDSIYTDNSVSQEIKEKKDINKREKKNFTFSTLEEARKYYEDHPEELEDDDV